jgi:hypothetical protein
MKEITREINGTELLIGYSYMTYPNAIYKKPNKAYKMLRLVPKDEEIGGDIFFFKYDDDDWYLMPELSFLSIESPLELILFYQNISLTKPISFEEFVDMLAKGDNL